MKVYFSVVGIGLGHMTRCLSIAQRLSKEGMECIFSTYGKAAELSRKEGYETLVSKPVMWHEDKNGQVDFETTLLKGPHIFKRMVGHFVTEDRRLKKIRPDIVVSDSRYSTIPASKNIFVPRVYITNQPKVYMPRPNNGHSESLSPLEYIGTKFNYKLLSGQDKIILPDFPLPYSVSERHMKFQSDAPERFKNKTEFVGPISRNRPGNKTEEEIEEVCNRYGVTPGEFIYIAFSGPGTIKMDVREAIFDLFSNYDTQAIMGTGEPSGPKFHDKGNLRLVRGWIDERDALMEASKVVICRAGLSTLSEILAFGKRTVVIPQSNQPEQESNTMGIEKLGLAKGISPEEINLRILRETIQEVEKSEKIGRAAKRMKKMADEWKGEENSAKIILDLVNN